MNRSILVYSAILLVSMGLSWVEYTDDSGPEKEGVILLEGKKDELERIAYTSPDLDVTYEIKSDALGKYGWVTVVDHKQKKPAKEGDPPPPVEVKTNHFKAGTAGDKVVETFAPLAALRELEGVDEAKLETFGLKAPDTTVVVSVSGRTVTLELGGETYGTKDRYARVKETGKLYVIDDEAFKPLKFAGTRLPEKSLYSPKANEIDTIALGAGATTVRWTHKNKDDAAADFWERQGGAPGKDETFENWFEKAGKIKSQSYVADADKPADLTPVFDLTVEASGKPAETVRVQKSGEDYYAQSEFTRGLVKLSRGPTDDAAQDVDDILEGRTPPEKPKKEPPKLPVNPAGDKPPMPGRPPGMPPRPQGMPPKPG